MARIKMVLMVMVVMMVLMVRLNLGFCHLLILLMLIGQALFAPSVNSATAVQASVPASFNHYFQFSDPTDSQQRQNFAFYIYVKALVYYMFNGYIYNMVGVYNICIHCKGHACIDNWEHSVSFVTD